MQPLVSGEQQGSRSVPPPGKGVRQDGLKRTSPLRRKCVIGEGTTVLGRLDFHNKEMIVTE